MIEWKENSKTNKSNFINNYISCKFSPIKWKDCARDKNTHTCYGISIQIKCIIQEDINFES